MAFVLTLAAVVTGVFLTAPPAPADTGAACSGTFTIGWQTPSNSPPDFGATVTVTNNASYTIQTWTVSWTFTAGQTIVAGSPYSANVTQAGTTVTATPGGTYNAVLSPGQSTTFGFDGDYNGTSNPVPSLSCAGPTEGTGSATLNGSLDPLGVNTASWDTNFVDPAIASSLSSASTGLLRYPGGSYADGYLWQPNTYQGTSDPVDFAQYATQTDAITNGQKFVTVNYVSDTPQDAAAWVTQSKTSGQGVSLWEIGNEEYGSWEIDNHANPHTATSYASNALGYMQAMKAANPSAQICYDYGMDGNLAPGSGVTNYQQWNDTILSADAADINCADVHWYPINGTPTENVQSIMSLVDNIPAAAAEVHLALNTYDPSAYFVVGETNMSQTANEWNEEPVGALFAAANSLEWLSFGAQSVDWWDVHNSGTPTGDFGMFSSATSGEPAMDTPYPPYYGYLLASKLAVKGAKVGTLVVSNPNVYAYYSQLPSGSYDVMLINADPSNGSSISTSSLGFTSSSETSSTYSAANPSVVSGTVSGSSVSMPAQSIVVRAGTGSPPGKGGNTVTVTNPGSQTGKVGTAASVQVQASDSASGQTLTYSATGLPAGLSISSSTGLISGTPTTAGNSSVTVTATDGTSASGSATFSWTVNPVGNTVTVTNPGAQTSTTGTAASVQIKATDSGSGQTLTYTATGLPAGLSISSSTGLISGTPTTAGSSSVTVTATDTTGASGSATFTWTVNGTGGGGSCKVAYTTNSSWPGGFTAQVAISNTGSTAISSWSLVFTFPGDEQITSNFNGGFSQSGETATLTNASYNGAIAPGSSITVGFQGTWTNSVAAPTSFSLNGAACTT